MAQIDSQATSTSGNPNYEEHLNRLLDDLRGIDLSGDIVDETPHLQAHGGYCDIFIGKSRKHGDMTVAVKRLRVHIFRDKDASKVVLRELRIWSSLKHPNVLPLLGFVMHGEYPALVSQWMVNGSVRIYMEKAPDTSILHMARGIAAGLVYLHDKDIIHSDLKSDNILVSENGDPLLADFGISRIMHMTTEFATTNTSTGVMGTTRWMAIELWLSSLDTADETNMHMHTKQTDVWAFGMVLYELLTGRVPFHHLKNDLQVSFAIANGQIPSQPSTLSDENHYLLWSICQQCWKRSPLDRPEVPWLLDRLSGIGTSGSEATTIPQVDDEPNRTSKIPVPSSSDPLRSTHNATLISSPLNDFKFLKLSLPSNTKFISGTPRAVKRPSFAIRTFVMHPFLAVDSYTRTVSLCWDVRLPPSTATVHPTANKYRGMKGSRLPNLPLDHSELLLPATHPPTTRMEVSIPNLPWKPFTVVSKRSDPTSRVFVTVSDLLIAVYDSLQKRLQKTEWDALPAKKKAAIADAFRAHCKLVGNFRAKELVDKHPRGFSLEDLEGDEMKRETMMGLRRVDCLGGLTEFFGLNLLAGESIGHRRVWKLTLAPPSS